MDNSAGWGSYSLVNAYIWVGFGLVIGIGFFDNPWTAVMYAVWAMAVNIVARKAVSMTNQRRHTVVSLTDAGSLSGDDSLVEDFGALDSEDEVVMANDDKVKIQY